MCCMLFCLMGLCRRLLSFEISRLVKSHVIYDLWPRAFFIETYIYYLCLKIPMDIRIFNVDFLCMKFILQIKFVADTW